jgi:hypothetical protein
MYRIKPEEALEHPWLANWIKSNESLLSQSDNINFSQKDKQITRRNTMQDIQHLTCKESETGMPN